jgi:hypothetical protein
MSDLADDYDKLPEWGGSSPQQKDLPPCGLGALGLLGLAQEASRTNVGLITSTS